MLTSDLLTKGVLKLSLSLALLCLVGACQSQVPLGEFYDKLPLRDQSKPALVPIATNSRAKVRLHDQRIVHLITGFLVNNLGIMSHFSQVVVELDCVNTNRFSFQLASVVDLHEPLQADYIEIPQSVIAVAVSSRGKQAVKVCSFAAAPVL